MRHTGHETIDADWVEDSETLEERGRESTTPKKRFDPQISLRYWARPGT